MTWQHLSDLAQSLLLTAAVFAALFGYGAVMLRLFSREAATSLHNVLWAGWALLMMLLAAVHLFMPISGNVALLLLVGGLLLCLPARSRLTVLLRSLPLPPARLRLPLLLFAGGFVFWLLSRVMVTPTLGDSGGYHFSAITWINEYAIVPGLGNLNTRLAMYQSSFLFNAWLNVEPYFNHGYALAGPLLTLLALLTVWERAGRLAADPQRRPTGLIVLLFVVPIVAVIIELRYVAGPSADSVSSLVILATSLIWLQIADDRLRGRPAAAHDVGLVVLLAATLITMKASNGIFAALLTITSIPLLWPQRTQLQTAFLRAVAAGMLIGIVFLARNIIISGYPLFPLEIGAQAVEWRISATRAEDIRNGIYYHARYFADYSRDRSIISEPWLPFWLARISRDWPYTFVAAAVNALLIGVMLRQLLRRRLSPLILLVLLPTVSGLIFWWLSAPTPRFALGLLLSLPLLTAWALTAGGNSQPAQRMAVALLVLAVLPSAATLYHNHGDIVTVSLDGYQPLKVSTLFPRTLPSGLTIYEPENGRHCWDSVALCGPRVPDELRLIGDSPQDGFSVLPPP